MRLRKSLSIALAIVMLSMTPGAPRDASAGLKKIKKKAFKVVQEAGNSLEFTGELLYHNLKPKNWSLWTPLLVAAAPLYPGLYFLLPRCACPKKRALRLRAEQEKLLKEIEKLESHLKTVVFDGIEFVEIPAGEFLMGSTRRHALNDEQPVSRVRISRKFYLGKYEVTQGQWESVMGSNPSGFEYCGGNCPVERVSWEDAQIFIGRLNARSGGGRYRLPTEAEWEYAARAGTTTDTYAGDITQPLLRNDPVLNGIAWYDENSPRRIQPVGRRLPNRWGLYDMLGNVWEWVGDWHGPYPGGVVADPAGPRSGSHRIVRGCSWNSDARLCRSANRDGSSPGYRNIILGFRLVREE